MGTENVGDFSFVIYPWSWDGFAWTLGYIGIPIIESSLIGRNNGNFIYDLTTTSIDSLSAYLGEPIPIGKADFLFSSSGSFTFHQVCTLQWFGWYYC
jgi:hypothetical protein